MPEFISQKQVFSLLEVTQSIQKTLAERYKSVFWVKAEMNKLNHYSHSGHCYPELVEKRDGKVIAQMKSVLWRDNFVRVNGAFMQTVKEPIKDGINILFCAAIMFDPSHGLSLNILDIDPVFSLGELEREKQETIEKLQREGIYHQNKKLQFPRLPQRIAVISVETSKGYSDYLKVIDHNPWGYAFFNFLFPALLQGDKSVASILYQLRRIRKVLQHFDVVAIIRGGGGDVGLSSFNNYQLAREIALFPVPVITGIGHSTNETVAEMVSHLNAITPTALADHLIQAFHNFSVPVREAEKLISERAKRMLKDENQKLRHTVRYFQSVTHNRLLRNHNDVEGLKMTLAQQTQFVLKQESRTLNAMANRMQADALNTLHDSEAMIDRLAQDLQRQTLGALSAKKLSLQHLEAQVRILDPIHILRRGFTITLKDGKAIKHSSEVKPGDVITTQLAEGRITSTTTDTTQPDPNA